MAAYGALVSVMQILDQIHRHPRPPISIHNEQVESLTANVTFLQEFLEGYNPHVSYSAEADPLESRIAEAAYAAEDVIESYIVDQILSRTTDHVEEISSTGFYHVGDPNVSYTAEVDPLESRIAEAAYAAEDLIESYIVDQIHSRSSDHAEEISSTQFYQGLQKVIEEMDLIKMEINKQMKEKKNMRVQIVKKSTTGAADPLQSSSTAQKVTTMVGFDDVLYEMLDRITGAERVRQIIPIVGMGGLGKTTLARNIYANQLVKEHFDIRAWSTISQVHDARKILSEILTQVSGKNWGDLSERDLGVTLYKYLIGKRYLIVMDDIWSIEAWDRVRSFFPENEKGSRVLVTTRLSNLASKFNSSDGLNMKFLDEASSWNLFCKTVFGNEICPLELEEIGRKIVEGCRGLPLSIVVVGGLLSKSEATRENWKLVEENLSSVVNSEDDGSCLQILYVSYNNLPAYLKPCFLYMGVFPEDDEIVVDLVIPLWVGEGIIKPFEGKSLEEVAKDCIQELVDRNLILVEKRDDCGIVKLIKIHDLLRDLALREGEKDKFLCVLRQSSGDGEISRDIISAQRRITNSFKEEYFPNPLLKSLEPASSLVRSFIGILPKTFSISNFRLLRVCINMIDSDYVEEEESSDEHYEENFVRLVNSRVIMVNVTEHIFPTITSWASFLWNLQTLYLMGELEDCVLDIWNMPLLRHVICEEALSVPDPPLSTGDDMDEVVLQNLHILGEVTNLILSENVVKRIPNVNRLALTYGETSRSGEELGDDFCLNNLCRLHKLHLLQITTSSLGVHQHTLTFPYSLKELRLQGTMLHWENMKTKIGCLPLLQILKLEENSFTGSEWETVEGQFPSLKVLAIENCNDLECWITDDTHFPRLEYLSLNRLTKLREIPSSIGDIPTLRSIKLYGCSDSANESARILREEQEEYDNKLLQIQVIKRFI